MKNSNDALRTADNQTASGHDYLLRGLRVNDYILPGEDPAEFLALLHDYLDRFQPVGPTEESLVLRITTLQWRLKRVSSMKASLAARL